MSQQQNSVQEDPTLTKDADSQLSVSNTTNLDPQTVEYNTTPEVAADPITEQAQAEDDVKSLEAYVALLSQATDGISKQTERVINVHLQQIDRRLGTPVQYGLESFDVARRDHLVKGNISLEAIKARLLTADVRHYKTQVALFTKHRQFSIALEEVENQGDSRLQKFVELLNRLWEWLKEKFNSQEQQAEKLVTHTEEVAEGIHANIGNNKYAGKPVEDFNADAAVYGDKVNMSFDVEPPIIHWLSSKFIPWYSGVLQDNITLMQKTIDSGAPNAKVFETEFLNLWAKWADNYPKETFDVGANRRMFIDPDILQLTIERSPIPEIDGLVIRQANERQKEARAADQGDTWRSELDQARKKPDALMAEYASLLRTAMKNEAISERLLECVSVNRAILYGSRGSKPAMNIVHDAVTAMISARWAKADFLEAENDAIVDYERKANRPKQESGMEAFEGGDDREFLNLMQAASVIKRYKRMVQIGVLTPINAGILRTGLESINRILGITPGLGLENHSTVQGFTVSIEEVEAKEKSLIQRAKEWLRKFWAALVEFAQVFKDKAGELGDKFASIKEKASALLKGKQPQSKVKVLPINNPRMLVTGQNFTGHTLEGERAVLKWMKDTYSPAVLKAVETIAQFQEQYDYAKGSEDDFISRLTEQVSQLAPKAPDLQLAGGYKLTLENGWSITMTEEGDIPTSVNVDVRDINTILKFSSEAQTLALNMPELTTHTTTVTKAMDRIYDHEDNTSGSVEEMTLRLTCEVKVLDVAKTVSNSNISQLSRYMFTVLGSKEMLCEKELKQYDPSDVAKSQ